MLVLFWILAIAFVLSLVGFAIWAWNSKKPELAPLVPILALGATIAFQTITFLTREQKEDTKRQEEIQITLLFLKNEIGINSAIANENSTALEKELSLLKEHKSMLNPLTEFKSEMWNVAKSRGAKFIVDLNDVNRIERAYAGMEIVNYKIRSRENYRLANQAMSNFEEAMVKMDTGLLANFEEVKKATAEGEAILDRVSASDIPR
jgi:hypothetical protein